MFPGLKISLSHYSVINNSPIVTVWSRGTDMVKKRLNYDKLSLSRHLKIRFAILRCPMLWIFP